MDEVIKKRNSNFYSKATVGAVPWLKNQRRNRQNKSLILDGFIREIETRPLVADEFDEKLWLVAIGKVIVHTADDILFSFRDGTVVNV
jgi:site-specific DNA recombinase